MAADHAENTAISILEIKDPSLSGGVQALFSARSNFIIYGVQREKKTKGSTFPQYIHDISPKSALYNDSVRKLVSESHSIFLSLNSRVSEIQDEKRKFEVEKFSKRYRSVLLVCIEDLHSELAYDSNEEIAELEQMFSDIELLWNLLQSLIIDTHSISRVLYKLLEWIKWHFVFPEKKREELMELEEPCSHPDYWDTVMQLLLQGKIRNTRALLQMHRNSNRDDFLSLDELLRKMPMYDATCTMSLNEFHMKWKFWQTDCRNRLNSHEFSADENLEATCKILCGDHKTLTDKSYLCVNWYHLMISVLLYTNPCISLSALGDTARTYYNNVTSSGNKSNIVDSIILAAMELDIMNVINLTCFFNDGWWFAAHIMDLFMHGNTIEKDSRTEFRSFLLQNYADTLMSHHSLYQIGIGYLDHCDNSRDLIESYLERVPLKTEAGSKKVIYLAMRRNLDSLVKSVANAMTRKAISNGKLGTALTWVMYSKDVRFADEIADRWMQNYIKNREIESLEILKNMGSCMLVSDKLTFVGKYCEFHKLYNDRLFKQAASLLVSLVSSEIASPSFQMIMLWDVLPLLEAPELIISSKDTYKLMKYLEEAVTVSNTPNNQKKVFEGTIEQDNIIRLALVRNLAKALVVEVEDSESEEET